MGFRFLRDSIFGALEAWLGAGLDYPDSCRTETISSISWDGYRCDSFWAATSFLAYFLLTFTGSPSNGILLGRPLFLFTTSPLGAAYLASFVFCAYTYLAYWTYFFDFGLSSADWLPLLFILPVSSLNGSSRLPFWLSKPRTSALMVMRLAIGYQVLNFSSQSFHFTK